jgi:hypothetical protein
MLRNGRGEERVYPHSFSPDIPVELRGQSLILQSCKIRDCKTVSGIPFPPPSTKFASRLFL